MKIAYILLLAFFFFLAVAVKGMSEDSINELEERIEEIEKENTKTKQKLVDTRLELEEVKNENERLLEENEALIKSIENATKIQEDLEETLEKYIKLSDENEKLKKEAKAKAQTVSLSTKDSGAKGRLLGTFETTAYTADYNSTGKNPGDKGFGITASGMKARVGVVAVDPTVIPLHTRMYVEGYGECIAGDTGGAIKGNMVDVYFNSRPECRQWGRRPAKVYILD